MSAAPAIVVSQIGKRYRLGEREETADTLAGMVGGWFASPVRTLRRLRGLTRFTGAGDTSDTIWAVRDVSFQVAEGETIGIIGRNGAGKSTLLKILSRITPPSTGRAVLRGRVASLLEVGTGFHPELTGRENVYLNGTLLGMTRRQIDAKLEEIVEFAGIARFMDTPIKRYSSGMQVRLAFSVAAHLDAEILIVDEVLAVGDFEFQRKCLGRMGTLVRGGRTVIFVSHNMPVVKHLCSRGIVLRQGRVVFDGSATDAVREYMASGSPADSSAVVPPSAIRHSTGEAVIRRASASAALGEVIEYGAPIRLTMDLELREPIRDLFIDVKIQSADGTIVAYATNTFSGARPPTVGAGEWRTEATLTNQLHPGDYTLVLGLHTSNGMSIFVADDVCPFTVEKSGDGPLGGYPYLWSYGYVRADSEWSAPAPIGITEARLVAQAAR